MSKRFLVTVSLWTEPASMLTSLEHEDFTDTSHLRELADRFAPAIKEAADTIDKLVAEDWQFLGGIYDVLFYPPKLLGLHDEAALETYLKSLGINPKSVEYRELDEDECDEELAYIFGELREMVAQNECDVVSNATVGQ